MVICWSPSLLKIVPYHLYSIPFRLMMVTNASVIKATSATASNSSHMLLAMLTALHMAKTLCTSNTTRTKAALIIFTNNISLCYTSMSLKFTLNKKNCIWFFLSSKCWRTSPHRLNMLPLFAKNTVNICFRAVNELIFIFLPSLIVSLLNNWERYRGSLLC